MVPTGRRLLLLIALGGFAGCAYTPPPSRSQLEVRQAQTRDFDTPDAKLVMKAMLNVLQDEGYVVKNAVVDLGLITAAKDVDLAPGRSGAESGGLGGAVVVGGIVLGRQSASRYRKTEQRDFTGNVSEFGQQTRVRVSFQRRVLDNKGQVVGVETVDDPEVYQDFFSRMDKSVFLQRENL